jgi:hypothetical protein
MSIWLSVQRLGGDSETTCMAEQQDFGAVIMMGKKTGLTEHDGWRRRRRGGGRREDGLLQLLLIGVVTTT